MKKEIWVGVVVVVAILLFVLLGSGKKSPETPVDSNSTTPPSDLVKVSPSPIQKGVPTKPIVGMKVSLGGIFSEKGSYQCDYEKVSQDSRGSSVVYISDGKMRGEFRTRTALSSTGTIIVYDGDYLYVWTEGMSKGTISQPKTIADLPGIIPEDISSGRVLGSSSNNISWNCHAWSKVPSLLAKPSYVSFN